MATWGRGNKGLNLVCSLGPMSSICLSQNLIVNLSLYKQVSFCGVGGTDYLRIMLDNKTGFSKFVYLSMRSKHNE